MRPLTRLAFILVVLFFTALHLFAGNGVTDSSLSVLPTSNISKATDQQKEAVETSDAHICTCQILHLESSNYDQREVAVFAEKTNNGVSTDYTIAKSRIQKEKKILKKMFFDKVKVVAEIQATGSCKSMFYRLKTANTQLQLYTILDADIY